MRLMIVIVMTICFTGSVPAEVKPWDEAFKAQWYAGVAEITRYELKQGRYRGVHEGDAVLIFVTEDFLTDRQVKHERGEGPSTSVLKLNATRKFLTGVYPYSIMTSVFTPVAPDQDHSLKVTTSVQEWCGHTFTQFNYRDGGYKTSVRSYFQSEGDKDMILPGVLLEDEVWTRIRLAPERLPVGEVKIIPGTQFQRLAHQMPKVETATAELKVEGDAQVYTLNYTSIGRKLAITFEKDYPHLILKWAESMQRRGRWSTTTAKKTHSIKLDYWSKNGVDDVDYRKQLGLK